MCKCECFRWTGHGLGMGRCWCCSSSSSSSWVGPMSALRCKLGGLMNLSSCFIMLSWFFSGSKLNAEKINFHWFWFCMILDMILSWSVLSPSTSFIVIHWGTPMVADTSWFVGSSLQVSGAQRGVWSIKPWPFWQMWPASSTLCFPDFPLGNPMGNPTGHRSSCVAPSRNFWSFIRNMRRCCRKLGKSETAFSTPKDF